MNYELRLLGLMGTMGIVAAGCHGSDTLTPQAARCGPAPTLLVSAASYAPDAGAADQNFVVGMALDGSDLYFSVETSLSTGALMRVSKSGGAATQLASGYLFQTPVVTPTGIIVGYVDSIYTGGILSIPRNGGSATPLVVLPGDELEAPPVTDGTSVYFATDLGAIDAVPLTPGAAPAVPTQLGSDYPSGIGVFGQQLLLIDGAIGGMRRSRLARATRAARRRSAQAPARLRHCP